MTLTTIGREGLNLKARTRGSSSNTPVVLIHGYPDNQSIWDGVAEALAESFHVITYDVRGAGASDAPANESAYRLEQLARDLQAVVDHLIPGRPFHLVGHDWGGIQGWEAVGTAPLNARILSFTAISGPCLDHIGHWLQQAWRDGNLTDRTAVVRQALSSWYVGLFHLPWVAPSLWQLGFDRLWPWYLETIEAISTPEKNPTQRRDGVHGVNLYRANVGERIRCPQPRRADCPVQLIIPGRDHYLLPQLYQATDQWVERLYRSEIDATHWVPLTHPQEVTQHIRRFIEEKTAPERR